MTDITHPANLNSPAVSNAAAQAAPTIHPLVRRGIYAVCGTALVALCAHISIPLGFTPVPLTMQPFAVLLLGLLLDPLTAFASLALYLAEGASGLPVFSPHGPGGIAQLLGLTGGYLMAAPFAAAAVSLLSRSRRSFPVLLASAAVGDAILLFTGAWWLALHTHASLGISVLPFVPTDGIKVLAAALCARMLLSSRARKAA